MYSEHSFSQDILFPRSGMSKVFHLIWHETAHWIYFILDLDHKLELNTCKFKPYSATYSTTHSIQCDAMSSAWTNKHNVRLQIFPICHPHMVQCDLHAARVWSFKSNHNHSEIDCHPGWFDMGYRVAERGCTGLLTMHLKCFTLGD